MQWGEVIMKTPVFQAIKDLDYGLIKNEMGRSMSRPHYHDGYEIYLQTEGVREIFFQHDKYLLTPGTLCIIFPHIFHATKASGADSPYSRYIVNFSDKIFNSFLRTAEIDSIFNKLSSCIIQLDEEQTKTVIRHIENINNYWAMHLKGVSRSRKLAYMEVYRLLDSIIQMTYRNPEMLNWANASKISDSEIYNVLLYIDLHYNEDIEAKNMMKLAHMSKSSFYRSFRDITGDSFSHYLNRLRTSKAHEMLSQTNLPLYKIAENTGFSSTAHMTRIFKEVHGVSPSEYRRSEG